MVDDPESPIMSVPCEFAVDVPEGVQIVLWEPLAEIDGDLAPFVMHGNVCYLECLTSHDQMSACDVGRAHVHFELYINGSLVLPQKLPIRTDADGTANGVSWYYEFPPTYFVLGIYILDGK